MNKFVITTEATKRILGEFESRDAAEKFALKELKNVKESLILNDSSGNELKKFVLLLG